MGCYRGPAPSTHPPPPVGSAPHKKKALPQTHQKYGISTGGHARGADLVIIRDEAGVVRGVGVHRGAHLLFRGLADDPCGWKGRGGGRGGQVPAGHGVIIERVRKIGAVRWDRSQVGRCGVKFEKLNIIKLKRLEKN